MRVISGKYKGKKLNQPIDKITRPLKDVVKESIFNLILHSKKLIIKIDEANILDLFSGTGSFGIECLSRGAKKIIFCENYGPALKILKKNLIHFDEKEKIEIINEDIFKILKTKKFEFKFDLIFLDPPFKEEKINKLLAVIKGLNILKENGVIILHRNKKDKKDIDKNYNIKIEKIYGLSKILFISL